MKKLIEQKKYAHAFKANVLGTYHIIQILNLLLIVTNTMLESSDKAFTQEAVHEYILK